jgi:hypothetical protein
MITPADIVQVVSGDSSFKTSTQTFNNSTGKPNDGDQDK